MSTLILVRHGQANSSGPVYDQLSPLGEVQAARLGAWWARVGFRPDQVFVGPRVRHQQTWKLAMDAMGDAADRWPRSVEVAGLDEFPAEDVLTAALPRIASSTGSDAEAAQRIVAQGTFDGLATDTIMALFRAAIGCWMHGEVSKLGLESWDDFAQRVAQTTGTLADRIDDGAVGVAFTSAGFTATAAARALGLEVTATYDLVWSVYNGAMTELRRCDETWTVHRFNTIAHLEAEGLLTVV